MDFFLIGLWILIFSFWFWMWILNLTGFRKLTSLQPVDEHIWEQLRPSLTDSVQLSVIIAAKDEAKHIEHTIRSLWQQTLPAIEWIVINDRSTDATREILDQLEKEYAEHRTDQMAKGSRFRVVHLDALPAGWLGKNHALYQGAQIARGQWLLFTDADIVFHQETLRHAWAYVTKEKVDHLTLLPNMIAHTFFLRGFVGLFLFSLSVILRPWRANLDHRRTHGVGIGAFNLIHRHTYDAIGTHRGLAMRPDDDLILGMKVKQGGFRQRCLLGQSWISVEWYSSIIEAIRGLEKNVFAGMKYSVPLAGVMIFSYLFFFHVPYWLFGFTLLHQPIDYSTLVFSLGVIALQMTAMVWVANKFGSSIRFELLVLPLTTLLVGYTLARSVILAVWRKGVYWRGTFYSLQEMRQMKE